MKRIFALAAILICLCGAVAAQIPPLEIMEQSLPPLSSGVEFHAFLRARGGVPPYVWSVASGDLPDGINLSPEGLLAGRPTKPGTFIIVLKVEDSGHPAHSITKDFKTVVSASLLLEWLQEPKVRDNRIDGSVQVSNGSTDAYDLTVVIVAVAAQDSRATAIGYEHFLLEPGTSNLVVRFGDTLPHGVYAIHVDAVAEIPAKKNILRERLQTAQPLQIAVGP